MKEPLVLASSSPFRRMLMENAGLAFEAMPAAIDERALEQEFNQTPTSPSQIALLLARAKALDVSARQPGAIVIGSDQTMSLGDRVFHKPKSREDARDTLMALSGKMHQLNSGLCLARDQHILWEGVSSARLHVRELSPPFIESYLDRVGDKVMSSVGAYQLEGEGVQLFSAIEGDYFTILGLPMLPLLEALRNLGAIDG
ncbi:Maf-like protein [Rhizobium helianthi]|uniref:7-methyl-GTP pyrophosphatase n=1 Tax=Rhizobium helianthi TaxID=1132695 RepID=A0ABW4M6Z3_9HYPH